MAESNKILTVSYGTFSCTLEGFDDAFSTMKAIAEYFRDLAADDRFFGAEPPTPDAEMLAKLASRTAARRVEAHQDDNGIVLRQEATALTAAKPEAQPHAAAKTEVAAPVAAQPVAAAVVEPAPDSADAGAETAEVVADTVADTAPADDDMADDVAVDMPAVENVVAEAVADTDDEEDEMADAIAEFEAIAEKEATAEPTPQPRRPVLARNATAVVTRRPKAKAAVAPNRPRVQVSTTRPTRTKAAATPEAVEAPETVETGGNTVADKLARIRGVVARNTADAPNGFIEDQHAEGGDTKQAHEELAKAFELAAEASAEDLTPAAEDHAEESDAVAATRAAIAAEFAEREAEQAVEEDDLDLSAALAIANAPEDDDAEYDDFAEVDQDNEDVFDEEAFFADDTDEDDDDVAAAPLAAPVAEEVDAPRPVARVLKVKRRDFEAAVEDGSLEEDDDEPEIPEAISRGESSLSPQDEAELQSELSALEAEIAGDVADDEEDDAIFAVADEDDDEDDNDLGNAMSWDMDEEDEAEDAAFTAEVADDADDADAIDEAEEALAGPVKPRRRLLRGADDDMDHILAETDKQLGDSDGTRRRSAIQHLRAAVAATKAEKQAGAVAQDDEQEVADVYRDDLAQVVRPRRPVARGDAPSRRAEDRPAPLKLVAEQRVDLPGADANATPVRPRRVRMADLARDEHVSEADADAEAHARAAAANAASFSEFAERVGAAGLPDLLEAAASYLSFVEGRDQFTRPQLMVKARQALEDEFSREDGLRHFGRLLREGKLRKVTAGHFTVSDRISFRPEERAAG